MIEKGSDLFAQLPILRCSWIYLFIFFYFHLFLSSSHIFLCSLIVLYYLLPGHTTINISNKDRKFYFLSFLLEANNYNMKALDGWQYRVNTNMRKMKHLTIFVYSVVYYPLSTWMYETLTGIRFSRYGHTNNDTPLTIIFI